SALEVPMFILRAAVSAAVLVMCATVSQAQNLYGPLTGDVNHARAAPGPGAKGETLKAENGRTRERVTDEHGVYSFNDLQNGTYKVTIRGASFAEFVREGIPVTAGIVRRLDARLQVAQVREVVVVAEAAMLLQTDRGDVNAQISKDEI